MNDAGYPGKLRKILFNRVYKKVAIISSTVFILIAAIVAGAIIHYAQQNYHKDLKRKVTEFALIGAEQSREMFREAIRQNHISFEALFDDNYQKISLEEFKATYVSPDSQNTISDDYIRLLMDRVVEADVDEYYRYHTAYDRNPFLNKRALQIEEPILKTKNIDYAVLIDRNGYIPFHHQVNSRNLTGDLETDTFGNRARRIWRKTLGDTQIPGQISYYTYRRDTGTPYLNVNAPIMVDGKYWGAFLVGYKATEIDVAMSRLRQNAVLLILLVVGLTVIIYSSLIVFSLRPLSRLLQGVRRIDKGNLDVSIPIQSRDEIGYLSAAFNGMVTSLRNAEGQLKTYARDLATSNEKLQEYNRTLMEKVRARTRDLHAKNLRLEDSLKRIQEMQHQLIMQEKMAAMGNLVAGVAHEVNTPVGAVYSAADVTRRCIEKITTELYDGQNIAELKSNDRLMKALNILKDSNRVTILASQRISHIVRSLKTFARLDEADYQEANIHDGLECTLTLIDHELSDRITIDKNYGDIPDISCCPNQLNQVFMNILMNAVQAIKEGGQISIKTSLSGSQVRVEISDNGCGIPADDIARVFDPGFTTKGVGVGTGLGLSISHKIIQKHNGRISVSSETGRGTVFTIQLPINAAQSGAVINNQKTAMCSFPGNAPATQ